MNAARIIAIDGPAASGKSSTAHAVARELGLVHFDSGALYRAITWRAQITGAIVPPAIVAAADDAQIELRSEGGDAIVTSAGRGIEAAIRSAAVTAQVSMIAAIPEVRAWVDARLRAAVEAAGGGVVDGRDIGTIVFPDAALKVYLTASAAARATRRLGQRGARIDPDELERETARLLDRDRLDSGRRVAPLRRAADAIELDTTGLDFDAQVAAIVREARLRGL